MKNVQQSWLRRMAGNLSLFFLLAAILSLTVGLAPVLSQSNPGAVDPAAQPPSTSAPPALQAPLFRGEGDFVATLDTPLNRLLAAWRAGDAQALAEADSYRLTIEGDRVLVTLTLTDEAAAESARAALPDLGGQVTAHFRRWVDAFVPVSQLARVADMPGVSLVHRPIPVHALQPAGDGAEIAPQAGAHETEGVVQSNADDWHAAGYKGAGIKIAVLDSFQYYTDAQAQSELPGSIGVYPQGGSLNLFSDHGTAVAEIVYDMAPEATYTFASLPNNTCTEMGQYLVGMAQAGHDIISSSVGPLQCGAGDGDPATDPIAAAAQTVMNTYDTFFAQAAGNQAEKHWDGAFSDSGGSGWHEFAPGITVNQIGYLPAGVPMSLFLRWSAWPTTNQDYNFYLVYWTGAQWQIVAGSENAQTGTQPPTESILNQVPYEGYYGFAIFKFNASGNHDLNVINYALSFEYSVAQRSLVGPVTSPWVFGVAAVDVNSHVLESYSGQGPTYGPGGTLQGGGAQPHLAGFANVDTWVYSMQGKAPFNGTSAATPHVAGAAAVLLGANPCLSALEVGTYLKDNGVDKGAAGYDYQYGSGVLNLGAPTDGLCGSASPGHVVYLPLVER